jgi:uncharacterized protein (DUF1501 family)
MTTFDRRELLRLSAAGLFVHGVNRTLGGSTVLAAPSSAGPPRMLNIFLRGGNDAINTVIPQHDADYSHPLTRPSLCIASNQSLDLGVGGAHFHPALAKLKPLHDAGELASIQRVGYPDQNGSHFSSQKFWETAKPGDEEFQEGFVARWAEHKLAQLDFGAVSVSTDVQRMFSGKHVMPHIPSIEGYGLGNEPIVAKLLGEAPGGGVPGKGLIGSFHLSPKNGSATVNSTGQSLGQTIADLESVPPFNPPAAFFPTSKTELAVLGLPTKDWAVDFFASLGDAVHLLLFSECRIAGVELGDFDFHNHQGAVQGSHAERLAVLAHGVRSIRDLTLGGAWSDLVVTVESEFGRASRENASGGTDHGRAGLMFVAGGRVIGGVHNCDPVSWPSGATLFSEQGKFVAHAVDFRAVLAEIFAVHFGASAADLDLVIPGWSSLSGPEFKPLGILA